MDRGTRNQGRRRLKNKGLVKTPCWSGNITSHENRNPGCTISGPVVLSVGSDSYPQSALNKIMTRLFGVRELSLLGRLNGEANMDASKSPSVCVDQRDTKHSWSPRPHYPSSMENTHTEHSGVPTENFDDNENRGLILLFSTYTQCWL